MLNSIKANKLQYESQKIGMMYFRVAIVLFGAQLLMGLIAAIQFFYIQVFCLNCLIFP